MRGVQKVGPTAGMMANKRAVLRAAQMVGMTARASDDSLAEKLGHQTVAATVEWTAMVTKGHRIEVLEVWLRRWWVKGMRFVFICT